jgi:hypothetical protein
MRPVYIHPALPEILVPGEVLFIKIPVPALASYYSINRNCLHASIGFTFGFQDLFYFFQAQQVHLLWSPDGQDPIDRFFPPCPVKIMLGLFI